MKKKFNLINLKNQIKLKISFQNSFKACKISTFNCFFLSSVILHKSSTTAFTDTHNFGLVRPRNMNNISNVS